MTRRPDKKVASFHARNLALLGLAPDQKVAEALRLVPTNELPTTPEGERERVRRGITNGGNPR